MEKQKILLNGMTFVAEPVNFTIFGTHGSTFGEVNTGIYFFGTLTQTWRSGGGKSKIGLECVRGNWEASNYCAFEFNNGEFTPKILFNYMSVNDLSSGRQDSFMYAFDGLKLKLQDEFKFVKNSNFDEY